MLKGILIFTFWSAAQIQVWICFRLLGKGAVHLQYNQCRKRTIWGHVTWGHWLIWVDLCLFTSFFKSTEKSRSTIFTLSQATANTPIMLDFGKENEIRWKCTSMQKQLDFPVVTSDCWTVITDEKITAIDARQSRQSFLVEWKAPGVAFFFFFWQVVWQPLCVV